MVPPLLLAAGLVLAPAGGAASADAQKILGTWKISAEVEDGNQAPAERSQKVRLTFTADKVLLREGPDTQEGAYKLDPSRNPRTIELVPRAGPNKGKKLTGIYALEGDTLRVCVPTEPGKGPPDDFTAPPGSGRILLTLQRDK